MVNRAIIGYAAAAVYHRARPKMLSGRLTWVGRAMAAVAIRALRHSGSGCLVGTKWAMTSCPIPCVCMVAAGNVADVRTVVHREPHGYGAPRPM